MTMVIAPTGQASAQQAVADAFVAIDDHGFSADHSEDVSLRTNQGAGGAANAVIIVDVRVLGLWAIRAESSRVPQLP